MPRFIAAFFVFILAAGWGSAQPPWVVLDSSVLTEGGIALQEYLSEIGFAPSFIQADSVATAALDGE